MNEHEEFGNQTLSKKAKKKPENLVDGIYRKIKEDIFEFELLPGDQFTETDIAGYVNASRTPVREALFRLENEGYLQCRFKNGWFVKPFDFKYFEDLYDLRLVIETASVFRLCEAKTVHPSLIPLCKDWMVGPLDRIKEGLVVSQMDERFHEILVESTGNVEMAKTHHSITERIRIIRRLDFTHAERLSATYMEHAQILQSLLDFQASEAATILKNHIEISRNEVRKITFDRLSAGRSIKFEKLRRERLAPTSV
jgi:DNA-binding GntR family transcriptional regulator